MTNISLNQLSGKVYILLGTYNGEEHLSEQIGSIQQQSFKEWVLLIRDDGSTDATIEIIDSLAQGDSRIRVVKDSRGNLGAAGNFGCLMQEAIGNDASFLFFADQDDVWASDKLEKQLALMLDMELRYPNAPILVHSDLEVVGNDLNVIAPSLMTYQKIYHQEMDSLKVLLVQNFITGCSVVANRRLLELALPLPEAVLMHDWWLALIAESCGHIGFVDTPLVKYRQHGANTVGAKSIWQYLNPFRLDWYRQWISGKKNLQRTMMQASLLSERLHDRGVGVSTATIDLYAGILSFSRIARLCEIRRLGIHAQSKLRHVLLLARLLTIK